MAPASRRSSRLDRSVALVFVALFVVLMFTGGASAPDEWHQMAARFAAIAALAFCALTLRRSHLTKVREVLLFLLLAVGVIVIQLIPLPPDLWSALPGRGMFAPAFELAGLEPVWRPLSLTPDRTLNSLLALLPPLAAAVCMAVLPSENERWPLMVLIGAALVAVIIGIFQVATGRFYFYRVTNVGWAVGLFANRSHQAVLLAATFPLLAAWAATSSPHRQTDQTRLAFAVAMAALLAAMVLATGSRAGLALGLLGMLGGFLIFIRGRPSGGGWQGRVRLAIPLLVVILAIAATLFWSRDLALQRLFAEEFGDIREALLPVYFEMVRDFFPFGSGMGSFDPVFRIYEPYQSLGPRYVNHAHNDVVQVVIEAGLLGAALMLLFAGWFATTAWRLWRLRGRSERDPAVLLGRAGTVVILVLLGSSLVEYPLRTPLLSFIFVVAAVWMLGARGATSAGNARLASGRRSDNRRPSVRGQPE